MTIEILERCSTDILIGMVDLEGWPFWSLLILQISIHCFKVQKHKNLSRNHLWKCSHLGKITYFSLTLIQRNWHVALAETMSLCPSWSPSILCTSEWMVLAWKILSGVIKFRKFINNKRGFFIRGTKVIWTMLLKHYLNQLSFRWFSNQTAN